MEPVTDLQRIAETVVLIRNVVIVLQIVGIVLWGLVAFYLRNSYVPRKEIDRKFDDLKHWAGNKISTDFGALRLEYQGTDKAHAAEIKGLGDRVDRHENRLTIGEGRFALLEASLQSLPTEASISALALAIEGLKGDVRVVSATVGASEAAAKVTAVQVNRIDDYLRRQEAHAA